MDLLKLEVSFNFGVLGTSERLEAYFGSGEYLDTTVLEDYV